MYEALRYMALSKILDTHTKVIMIDTVHHFPDKLTYADVCTHRLR